MRINGNSSLSQNSPRFYLLVSLMYTPGFFFSGSAFSLEYKLVLRPQRYLLEKPKWNSGKLCKPEFFCEDSM